MAKFEHIIKMDKKDPIIWLKKKVVVDIENIKNIADIVGIISIFRKIETL